MQLYNTLTRQKETFEPAGGEVTLYVCGITTSGYAHVGHALNSIAFEVLHRYLEYRGHKVKRVQNFTDIDDKVIARARIEKTTTEAVAEKYIAAFLEDMDALNWRRPTLFPRATEEIPEIIKLISGLVEKGFAYEAMGSVYFRVRKAAGYGKLSHRSVDEMLEGTRVEPEPGKEDAPDFALWKASKPGEPWWDSPWGNGRPGWHIECSAMAMRYLDETVDIHGGGLDLVFPHHENEIAQSEAFTGKPFARFFAHNGLLQLSGDKMSKSVGNIVRLRDALQQHSADAIRLWMLKSHYRSPLLYDDEEIESQERALHRLRNALDGQASERSDGVLDPGRFKERFVAGMDDDLNTPQAVAAIFDLVRQINRARNEGLNVTQCVAMLRELTGVLGLTLQAPEAKADALPAGEIERLIEKRAGLRSERQFAEADAVRTQLEARGIALADSPEGTTWTRV